MKNKWKLCFLIAFGTILLWSLFGEEEHTFDVMQTTMAPRVFKKIFRERKIRNKPKILLWTTFFGSVDWSKGLKNEIATVCNADCSVTDDKSELQTSDAIVFHLADTLWGGKIKNGFSFEFPRYRRQDQNWVLYNLEPLSMIFGNLGAWQGLFNLTMSYSSNSDIQTPYGSFRKLSKHELSRNVKLDTAKSKLPSHSLDYYHEKRKPGGMAIISNCHDDARRYRLIEEISKFINVDIFGKCGKPCPGDYASCDSLKASYQFYLAFENSNCREYVSEKYWFTLGRNQIPIVAWKHSMVGQVIPNSYINIYDFPDIESAGAFIKRVGENRTLYNSYFDWKKTYKRTYEPGFCKLCKRLNDPTKPAQSYADLHGWFASFSCKPVTVSNHPGCPGPHLPWDPSFNP